MSTMFTFVKHDNAGFAPFADNYRTALYDLLKRGLVTGGDAVDATFSLEEGLIKVTSSVDLKLYAGQCVSLSNTGDASVEEVEYVVMAVNTSQEVYLSNPQDKTTFPASGKIKVASLGWLIHTDTFPIFAVKRDDPEDDLVYVFDRTHEQTTISAQYQTYLAYYVARDVDGVLSQITPTAYVAPRPKPINYSASINNRGLWCLFGDKDTFYLQTHSGFSGYPNDGVWGTPQSYQGYMIPVAGGLIEALDPTVPIDMRSFYTGMTSVNSGLVHNTNYYEANMPFSILRTDQAPSSLGFATIPLGTRLVRFLNQSGVPIAGVMDENANIRGVTTAMGYAVPPFRKMPMISRDTFVGFLRGFSLSAANINSLVALQLPGNSMNSLAAPSNRWGAFVYTGRKTEFMALFMLQASTVQAVYPIVSSGVVVPK